MKGTMLVFIFGLLPFFGSYGAYSPIELGMNDESTEQKFVVFSLKCDTNALGYVLASLDTHGFTILSISCIDTKEPRWIVNYCLHKWSLEGLL